jgi:hypothetical protein
LFYTSGFGTCFFRNGVTKASFISSKKDTQPEREIRQFSYRRHKDIREFLQKKCWNGIKGEDFVGI